MKEMSSSPIFGQTPTVTAKTQTGAPILISSTKIVSLKGRDLEFAFDLINLSSKPVRAYAVKLEIDSERSLPQGFSLTNLDLTNAPLLMPNVSITNFDTYQVVSDKEQRIILSVDYVEFADGTHWGNDSSHSAERSAGQRTAAHILSQRLLRLLNGSNPKEVVNAIAAGAANLEPPADRSEEWKAGFRSGCSSLTAQLQRAQKKGGLQQIEQDLRALAKRFEELP